VNASNAYQGGNLTAVSSNISGVANYLSLVTSNVGIGTLAYGNTLSVQGNAWFSNSLWTTNVAVTNANVTGIANVGILSVTSNAGIGTLAYGNTLSVQGNAWFSNSLWTTNVAATSANVLGDRKSVV
jgi:predicted secreted hydrolase